MSGKYRKIILPLLLVFMGACTVPQPKKTDPVIIPQPEPAVPAIEQKEEVKTPPSIPVSADDLIAKIIVKTDSGEEKTIRELAGAMPVMIDLSASWCEPCQTLTERLNKLNRTFGNKVFFLMLVKPNDDISKFSVRPEYPAYYLVKSPDELGLHNSEILPKVIAFGSDGAVAAEMEGLYPSLHYYSVLADL